MSVADFESSYGASRLFLSRSASFFGRIARRLRRQNVFIGLATILFVMLLWQIAPTFGIIDKHLLPPASTVLARYFAQVFEPGFYVAAAVTLMRVLLGFVLALVVAIPLGLAMGYWRFVGRMFGLTIEVLRPIPSSALVPVAALILGIGDEMHIAIVFAAAVIPILSSTVDGVCTVDPILIQTARTMGRRTGEIFRTVLLPAALPHVATGLRISLTIALLVGISSEMLVGSEGLGRRVVYAQRVLDISGLYAGVLTLATLGFALNRLCLFLQDRFLGWHAQSKAKNWT